MMIVLSKPRPSFGKNQQGHADGRLLLALQFCRVTSKSPFFWQKQEASHANRIGVSNSNSSNNFLLVLCNLGK